MTGLSTYEDYYVQALAGLNPDELDKTLDKMSRQDEERYTRAVTLLVEAGVLLRPFITTTDEAREVPERAVEIVSERVEEVSRDEDHGFQSPTLPCGVIPELDTATIPVAEDGAFDAVTDEREQGDDTQVVTTVIAPPKHEYEVTESSTGALPHQNVSKFLGNFYEQEDVAGLTPEQADQLSRRILSLYGERTIRKSNAGRQMQRYGYHLMGHKDAFIAKQVGGSPGAVYQSRISVIKTLIDRVSRDELDELWLRNIEPVAEQDEHPTYQTAIVVIEEKPPNLELDTSDEGDELSIKGQLHKFAWLDADQAAVLEKIFLGDRKDVLSTDAERALELFKQKFDEVIGKCRAYSPRDSRQLFPHDLRYVLRAFVGQNGNASPNSRLEVEHLLRETYLRDRSVEEIDAFISALDIHIAEALRAMHEMSPYYS